ncbi:MAG TPA: DUF1569 domain-containing protein [Candidatus Hydrogenedentes bacterium]|nr:DUF1569 domain-containing protein [Candidatus Hydrogenedentota bacterium]
MRAFDHDFVNETAARLNRIKVEAKPLWGTMTAEQMFGHLAGALRFAMGRGPEEPDRSTWFTRRVIAPLLLRGILKTPRNVKGIRFAKPSEPLPVSDAETVHALLESYLAAVQSGELNPPDHPMFGNIGVDGWAKLHVLHFDHHLRQFGV